MGRAVGHGDLHAVDVCDQLVDDGAGQAAHAEHAGARVGGAGDVAGGGAHEHREGQGLLRLTCGDHAQGALGVAHELGLGQVQAEITQVVDRGDLA